MGALQALVGAHDADIVPHEAAQLVPVVRDHHHARRHRTRGFRPSRQRHRRRRRLRSCARGCLARAASANTRHSSSELLARRLAPCRPVKAHSPTAYRPARSVRACEVGHHAAAGVVRGRHHRDRLAGDVVAEFAGSARKWSGNARDELGRLVADVEVHAVEAAAFHFVVDGARHDVARREFAARVVSWHERRAVRQQQTAALAAHRLGDQERLGAAGGTGRSGGTARIPCWPPGSRRARPWRRRRRSRCPGCWYTGTPWRRRRWRAPRSARCRYLDMSSGFFQGVQAEDAVVAVTAELAALVIRSTAMWFFQHGNCSGWARTRPARVVSMALPVASAGVNHAPVADGRPRGSGGWCGCPSVPSSRVKPTP